MIEPSIVNVICPNCKLTWMNIPGPHRNYICYQCGHTRTEEQAKQEAWKSASIYYGE